MGLLPVFVISCDKTTTTEDFSTITFTIGEFEEDLFTRTGTTYDGTAITYQWLDTDTLGIFPNEGYQVAFPIGSQAGGAYATFDGGGWALKNNATYMAYYPFEYMNKKANRIPMVFTGQIQDGDNLNHIGSYDYLASVPTSPENGNVNFLMKHLACLVLFELTMPGSEDYTVISINSDKKVFVTSAYLDLSDGNFTMIPNTTSDHVVLNTKNVTVGADNILKAYMMVAPTDIGTASYKISVKDSAGRIYEADMSGRNKVFRTGAKKKITASPTLSSTPGEGIISTSESVFGEDMYITINY